jgi:hypothetical protein
MIVAGILIAGNLYAFILWTFTFMRTGLRASLLLAIVSVVYVFLAIVAVAYAYDLQLMKRFDPSSFLYGICYFVVQPLSLLFMLVGETALVLWIIRVHRPDRPKT